MIETGSEKETFDLGYSIGKEAKPGKVTRVWEI